MDQFAKCINVDSSVEHRRKLRQQNINDAPFKSRSNEVHAHVARWVYESGIPFNAINNDAFHKMVEAIGQFGPGYLPPSLYQLREPLLKQETEKTKESLRKEEEEWVKSGCSIMTDAWTDRKRRSIMNLCVNCKGGTMFLSSVENSLESHTGKHIFEYVDKHIETIGPEKVIQVVTNNASNNKAAAKLLKVKRPNIFWSACATHTLNLILEGIGKLPMFNKVIEKAKALTIFIYAHHKSLALMRKFTKKRDTVRPGVTRFASSFLTLESILEKKESLKFMFNSEEWDKCKLSTTTKGRKSYLTICSTTFWKNLATCIHIFKPLVRVLRFVDGDVKPSMGFVYGELLEAKKEIITMCKDEELYQPIIEIIDSKSKGRLDSPLHVAGYYLNPYYYFKGVDPECNDKCMEAIIECSDAFYPNDDNMGNIVLNVELVKYKSMEGMFGRKVAIMGRSTNDENYNPVMWWSNYGGSTPNLQKMAMKILSLTSSSSGCERNWSSFEGIHTKKRNKLDAERLNNLVYIQFNAKLMNRRKKTTEKCDTLLADDASMAQGWIVEGDDVEVDERLSSEDHGIDTNERNARELDEDDFVSDVDDIDEYVLFKESNEDRW